MRIKNLLVILAGLTLAVPALANHHEDGEKKPFSIYGDFATSMSFLDNENNGSAAHDDFNVDLIEINLEKNWSKSKLHLSIGYGTTAIETNFNPNSANNPSTNTFNVMNAYYKMMSSYGLNFWVGKFESPVGFETYNHMDISQFTRSYGFVLAPFFSTGLGIEYGMGMWNAGLIVSNGSGEDTDTQDQNKTMGIVVDVDPMDNLHFDLNYVVGNEGTTATIFNQITILDVTAAYMVNEMLDFAVNYIDHQQTASTLNAQDLKATSVAAYVNANFGMFGLGLRYEQFDYDFGIQAYNGPGDVLAAPGTGTPGEDNSIAAITLAVSAEVDQNAMVMLEYRQDTADDNGTFTDKDGQATDAFNTITAALMYRF